MTSGRLKDLGFASGWSAAFLGAGCSRLQASGFRGFGCKVKKNPCVCIGIEVPCESSMTATQGLGPETGMSAHVTGLLKSKTWNQNPPPKTTNTEMLRPDLGCRVMGTDGCVRPRRQIPCEACQLSARTPRGNDYQRPGLEQLSAKQATTFTAVIVNRATV